MINITNKLNKLLAEVLNIPESNMIISLKQLNEFQKIPSKKDIEKLEKSFTEDNVIPFKIEVTLENT